MVAEGGRARAWAWCGRRQVLTMAVNVLMPLLIPLGEQITNVTQLVGRGSLVFTPPRAEVFVEENTSAPVHLLTLHAVSNTTGMGVIYSMVGGGVGGLFRLDAHTGYLTLTAPLDYEARSQYELVVMGEAGEERAYARVMVQVDDVNDLAPTFSRPVFETQITEEDDRHLPKAILQVIAEDGDESDEGRLVYTLAGDDHLDDASNVTFSISPSTGHIHLLRPLDRDAPAGRARWRLWVTASDGVHDAHAQVHVNVKDINDNAPFFPRDVIDASVLENSAEGTEVARVEATDHDDPLEGANAAITYSVDKNVIDEQTGRPIFSIDTFSGSIRTALCCLDREQTPSFVIQVVASDGGGLKGTGTVVVSLEDRNDVPPRFNRREWTVRVQETAAPNTSLALLTLHDPDTTNQFAFRVVEGSGYGWERFAVVAARNYSGSLRVLHTLDFEDPDQRRGFKFRVQVSDREERRWEDESHMDEAWVRVTLEDDNDNDPHLATTLVSLTLAENTPLGHPLATFAATDLDQGGDDEIHYAIDPSSDPGRRFAVDSEGRVRLRRVLDREAAAGHTVRVLAVDGGDPARTGTATLQLTVTDVNDNPPHVSGPALLQVPENSGPRHVAHITLDDADDWTLGHGPPFTIALAEDVATHVKQDFAVDFDPRGDEGRGVAVVTSLRPLDREKAAARPLPLRVADAGGLAATVTVTITVADVNDNPMRPAVKTVVVTRVAGQAGEVPLGRVYVQDPDDWDALQKRWAWRAGSQHPLFTLDAHTGQLAMAAHATDGTYFLQFWVSDATHGQEDVEASVSVEVTTLPHDLIPWAVPLTLPSHTPQHLIAYRQDIGKSPLNALVSSVEAIAGVEVVVVSLEGRRVATAGGPETRVWLAARPRQPLDQLLLLHRHQVWRESGVEVADVGVGVCLTTRPLHQHAGGPRAWLVDANQTAVVTPRFHTRTSGCNCRTRQPQILQQQQQEQQQQEQQGQQQQVSSNSSHQPSVAAVTRPYSCLPNPCLNGGRCIARPQGPRCVCPQGTSGSICKQLSRRFEGEGWAWVSPVPTCPRVHLSFQFQTSSSDCLLLYAGPRPSSRQLSTQFLQEDVLSVELRGGRPWVMLDLGTSPVLLAASHTHRGSAASQAASSSPTHHAPSLADGRWHRLDVIWGQQKAEVVVDSCAGGGECRVAASLPPGVGGLRVAAPLQVGGLAHAPPDHLDHGWPAPLTPHSFRGCMRHLRINGELRDLGREVVSHNSSPGCPHHDACPPAAGPPCPHLTRCSEGQDGGAVCECALGWTGDSCHLKTQPSSFAAGSYIKMALTASPPPNTTSLQLRFRTWEESGLLLAVMSHHGRDRLTLQLTAGHLCLQLVLHHRPDTQLCLSRAHLNDGKWHDVMASRYGGWMELLVDEGDGPLYNTTPTPPSLLGWMLPLVVDRHEGVHVGGSPEYVGVSLHAVHNDYRDGCLDDLRVSGVRLPLPPLTNTSSTAQAAMFTNVHASCLAPAVCTNVSCTQPLTCVDVWRRHQCGCGEGAALMRDTGTCRDVNECLWSPCFNGGTCLNQEPGYLCLCSKSFTGEHCEVAGGRRTSFSLSFSALIIVLVLSLVILALVLGVYIVYQRRRGKIRKSLRAAEEFIVSAKISQELENGDAHDGDNAEIQMTCSLKAHNQSPVTKDTKLADVDVVHKDKSGAKKAAAPDSGCGCPNLPSLDDLRYYAYEGDGSSPGSLSSCCSGIDGVEEVRFLGGFQDVATLLNCLAGYQDPHSPAHQNNNSTSTQHVPNTLGTSSATNSAAGNKIDEQYTSPPKKFQDSVSEVQKVSGATNYDVGIKSALIHRKCNSLPRTRVPKIFVNNLHDDSCETVSCLAERGGGSPRRTISPALVNNTLLLDTYPTKLHTCTKITPQTEFDGNPLSFLSSGRDMCQACNTATLFCDAKCKNRVPRRSRSISTMSYNASGNRTVDSGLCSISQPLAGVPCTQSSCQKRKTCSYSHHQLQDTSGPELASSCACSANQISVISTKSHKVGSSDKLYIL
ncbi:LOW QUALITY PROTEIN: putative neural-cadherin 2 [Procambarus clarkii]|uniref:LOW QUALITY PROTEIN: putative neural-cadherin 2 n=1 Tax=Procambarus clarkii TaxID=6728 RepID=UPI0037441975